MSSITTSTPSGTALTSVPGQGTVTSTGTGSGLDINSIVTQLVNAESQGPTKLLTNKQSQIQAQLSAYGQFQASAAALQASLATLSTTAQFQVNAANVVDTTVATATATSDAAAGTYNLEVTQLASGAKLTSGPIVSATTAVGTGTLTIKVGNTSIPVTIDSTNNTLSAIAAAINKAGAANGIAASVLTANDGVRLVLTSATTGASNAVTVSQSGGDGGLSQLTYDPASSTNGLTQNQGAQDAKVKLDGFTYNSPSNVVTGALSGVTIFLKAQSATGVTTPLTIATDQTSARKAVDTFITGYNTLAKAISQLTSYNATTGSAGALLGDSLLNGFKSSVNNALNTSVPSLKNGPFSTLAEIGVIANTDGTLSADSAKLTAAFNNNYATVAKLFAGTDGVGTKLNDVLAQYTKPSIGILAQQTNSLQKSLADVATRQTALKQRMADYSAHLYAQYNAMDRLVASLKSTGTALQQALGSISYVGKPTASS
jgi:flagellar hook-associated protein 2